MHVQRHQGRHLGRRRRAAVTTAAVTVAAAVTAASAMAIVGAAPASGAEPSAPAPVQRYAPLVFLHPDDNDRPMSAESFIRNSSLRWHHDADCDDHRLAARGNVRQRRLGSGRYRHQLADLLCNDHGQRFRSNEHTRPRDDNVAGGEGFFLELIDTARGGSGTNARVYYDFQSQSSVTYWFLYGFNDAPASLTDHEGDWEQVTVRLNSSNQATDVAFYGHGDACRLPWSQVQMTSSGHPVAFSARGTHASYHRAGSFNNGIDVTERGPRWRTWRHLRNVQARPWYGYGGGWGQVGETAASTGPLGPSRFKERAPANWEELETC
jgi:Vacuolar protein sorting-associated protein 62